LVEGCDEACGELEDGDEEEVGDERPFAAEAVGDYAEEDLEEGGVG
jgi:hypothetical protein